MQIRITKSGRNDCGLQGRLVAKYIGEDQKNMFKLWMTGPMKPITKYGGLPKPTGCV